MFLDDGNRGPSAGSDNSPWGWRVKTAQRAAEIVAARRRTPRKNLQAKPPQTASVVLDPK